MTWVCELGLTVEQGKKILDKSREIREIHEICNKNKLGKEFAFEYCSYCKGEQARAFREIVEQSQLLITTNLVKISNKKELKK